VPLSGGGVASTATSRLGELNVLPVGGVVAKAFNVVAGQVNALKANALQQIDASTPLLSVDGITSSATAIIGDTASPCAPKDPEHPFACGSAGLNTIRVLGQPIDLAGVTGLGAGQSITKSLSFPGLGPNGTAGWLTLQITRGLPQYGANTNTDRSVKMAALSLRLINGCAGTCTDALALPGSGNAAAAHTATTSGGNGIAALGDDADIIQVAAAHAAAYASMQSVPGNPPADQHCSFPGSGPSCPVLTANVAGSTSLPQTGLFGGAALPAGLLLIAVAISLRLLPGLRTRLRGMR
jgi:hypothetical protein